MSHLKKQKTKSLSAITKTVESVIRRFWEYMKTHEHFVSKIWFKAFITVPSDKVHDTVSLMLQQLKWKPLY